MQRFNKDVDGIGDKQRHPIEQQATNQPPRPDRSDIQHALDRFRELSDLRLWRLKNQLLPSQRHFLELLPALVHCNHPVLPGYGPPHTPAGIDGFRIDSVLRRKIENYFYGFKLQDEHFRKSQIQGLYLIGSSGTLAQSQSSDLDCWICFNNAPTDAEIAALEKKCSKISEWARHFRLELHFFIMHEASFRTRRKATTGGEDCGGTQHFLLLDEFYRTAIHIAGRTPLWWVIPPAQTASEVSTSEPERLDYYKEFGRQIINDRFIRQNQFLDFGDTGAIPTSECLSASVWTLYKALTSPYKAIIKLMLIETYIVQGPASNLSDELKQEIHFGKKPVFNFDPYVQIFKRIESHLLDSGQSERLELLRHCFYRKADIKLSTATLPAGSKKFEHGDPAKEKRIRSGATAPLQSQQAKWRQTLLVELVDEWQWTVADFAERDSYDQSNMASVLSEKEKLNRELLSTYRRIDRYASLRMEPEAYENHRQSAELELLERHLKVVYRHKHYKVGHRLTGKDTGLCEKKWRHIEVFELGKSGDGAPSDRWGLRDHVGREKDKQHFLDNTDNIRWIKKTRSAEQIVLWCLQEGLADSNTVFHCSRFLQQTQPKEQANTIDSAAAASVEDQGATRQAQSINSARPTEAGLLLDKITRHIRVFFNEVASADQSSQLQKRAAKIDNCLLMINSEQSGQNQSLWDKVVLTERDDPLSYTGRPRNEVKNLSLTWSNTWGELFFRNFSGHDAVQQALQFYLNLEKTSFCQTRYECLDGDRPKALIQRVRQLFDDGSRWLAGLKGETPSRQRPFAFAFATADGVYLVSNEITADHTRITSPFPDSDLQHFWPLSRSIESIQEDINKHWQAHFDRLSFPRPGASVFRQTRRTSGGG